MVKKIKTYVKLQILSGMANPSPPIGPALGQQGLNIIEFCKLFNKRTENFEKGTPLPVLVTVYSDRTFTFIIKTPTASFLLKKYSGIEKGSSKTKNIESGKISKKHIYEIAKIKFNDMTGSNIKAIYKSILGTAYSMGLKINE